MAAWRLAAGLTYTGHWFPPDDFSTIRGRYVPPSVPAGYWLGPKSIQVGGYLAWDTQLLIVVPTRRGVLVPFGEVNNSGASLAIAFRAAQSMVCGPASAGAVTKDPGGLAHMCEACTAVSTRVRPPTRVKAAATGLPCQPMINNKIAMISPATPTANRTQLPKMATDLGGSSDPVTRVARSAFADGPLPHQGATKCCVATSSHPPSPNQCAAATP